MNNGLNHSETCSNREGVALVITPETERAFWQPEPASGFASVRVSPAIVPLDLPFSFGTQMLYPGGVVREHLHPGNKEVLHFIEGSGKAYLDGVEYALKPGVSVFIGKGRLHKLVNDGDSALRWVWFMTPNGLENFFEQAGKPKRFGEDEYQPFARTAQTKAIEDGTVF